jgi:hypothetical protein
MVNRLPFVLGGWLVLACLAAGQAPTVASLGPKPGSVAPEFSGTDQFGNTRTLSSLMGRDGLMLVFFRSADW